MLLSRWCPTCGAENLPQRRYCRHCGECFDLRCPKCGFTNLIGDLYCGGCGGALVDDHGRPLGAFVPDAAGAEIGPAYALPSALADTDGALDPAWVTASENRLATIVKADLSGFTAMSELLGDAEEVTDIMNQVFEPLVECVRRYRGHIDNYAGDMIIAFFGTPETVEGISERAVRAALDMRTEVERLNGRNISHGVELGISTGVATGFGLWGAVGIGANARKTISGELGDYAALLEKYADRGTVGVCPDTWWRIRHAISGEQQEGTVTPPGEAVAQPVYYAGEPLPATDWLADARAGGPFHGREDLLAQLREQWEQAKGHGAVVHLAGPAGVGKTRVLQAFCTELETDGVPVVAAAACPLSEALGDDLAAMLWDSLLAAAGAGPDEAAGWLQARGLERTAEDLADALRQSALERPCVVVLDGLDHLSSWPDAIVSALFDCPALVLLGARTRAPVDSLGPLAERVVTLTVDPLDRGAHDACAAEWLGGVVEDRVADWLWRWSAGNPLYARSFCEELLRREALAADDLDAHLRDLPWPVQELADGVVDHCDDSARAVLFAAAAVADPETLAFEPSWIRFLVAVTDWARVLSSLKARRVLVETEPGGLAFAERPLWYVCRRRMVDSVHKALRERGAEAARRLAAA